MDPSDATAAHAQHRAATFDLGTTLYEKLKAALDVEPLHRPRCNIVAFRHAPEVMRGALAEELGRFQLDLRGEIIESGAFSLVPTQADGVGALRVTLINPLTTPDVLDDPMDALRHHGQTLLGSSSSHTLARPARGKVYIGWTTTESRVMRRASASACVVVDGTARANGEVVS